MKAQRSNNTCFGYILNETQTGKFYDSLPKCWALLACHMDMSRKVWRSGGSEQGILKDFNGEWIVQTNEIQKKQPCAVCV